MHTRAIPGHVPHRTHTIKTGVQEKPPPPATKILGTVPNIATRQGKMTQNLDISLSLTHAWGTTYTHTEGPKKERSHGSPGAPTLKIQGEIRRQYHKKGICPQPG